MVEHAQEVGFGGKIHGSLEKLLEVVLHDVGGDDFDGVSGLSLPAGGVLGDVTFVMMICGGPSLLFGGYGWTVFGRRVQYYSPSLLADVFVDDEFVRVSRGRSPKRISGIRIIKCGLRIICQCTVVSGVDVVLPKLLRRDGIVPLFSRLAIPPRQEREVTRCPPRCVPLHCPIVRTYRAGGALCRKRFVKADGLRATLRPFLSRPVSMFCRGIVLILVMLVQPRIIRTLHLDPDRFRTPMEEIMR
mmetsp:Transcript_31350/g.75779  ORF Transcript_31350/g.75779 Transcript_31350/m.75779 type:complete len:245 (+) Transcript_31350:808-1542(+)